MISRSKPLHSLPRPSLFNGEGGIRTHAPLRTNGFQDRLVMTTSIPLRVRLSRQRKTYSSKCFLCCQQLFSFFSQKLFFITFRAARCSESGCISSHFPERGVYIPDGFFSVDPGSRSSKRILSAEFSASGKSFQQHISKGPPDRKLSATARSSGVVIFMFS